MVEVEKFSLSLTLFHFVLQLSLMIDVHFGLIHLVGIAILFRFGTRYVPTLA